LVQSPLIVLPDLPTALATTTPMTDGTVAGGCALFPGVVVNDTPHEAAGLVDGNIDTLSAKPLNDGTSPPPLTLLRLDQLLPHQLRVVARVAPARVSSPSTKAPRPGNAKTSTCAVSDDGR
jgi:hypothetical protein